jgi:hypothetical protein
MDQLHSDSSQHGFCDEASACSAELSPDPWEMSITKPEWHVIDGSNRVNKDGLGYFRNLKWHVLKPISFNVHSRVLNATWNRAWHERVAVHNRAWHGARAPQISHGTLNMGEWPQRSKVIAPVITIHRVAEPAAYRFFMIVFLVSLFLCLLVLCFHFNRSINTQIRVSQRQYCDDQSDSSKSATLVLMYYNISKFLSLNSNHVYTDAWLDRRLSAPITQRPPRCTLDRLSFPQHLIALFTHLSRIRIEPEVYSRPCSSSRLRSWYHTTHTTCPPHHASTHSYP